LNQNIKIAKQFHETTKHSPVTIYFNRHYLDWENKPFPFKLYLNKPKVNLPSTFPYPIEDSIECLKQQTNLNLKKKKQVDLKTLSQILFFSAGITRKIKLNDNVYYMRAASATGALYPIEIYLTCQDLPNLDAGVYHFCPGDFTLTQLRKGDFRSVLFTATGNNNKVFQAPITLIFTSISWRNSWKYQARSYRHWFWDAGVILANFLALCNNNHLSSEIILGYQDKIINNLLGLQDQKEVAIALASIENDCNFDYYNKFNSSELSALNCEFKPISKYEETVYPEIWKIHECSYLSTMKEITNWTLKNIDDRNLHNTGKVPYDKISIINTTNIGNLILQRGSTRRFLKKPITLSQLQTVLYLSSISVPFDFITNEQSLIDIYFIANSVTNLQSGMYYYNKLENNIEQLKEGDFREQSGHLCLDQKLFSDASVVFFLLSSMDKILTYLGNRGYRAIQLEGGICAGKIYLTSYSQGLGASGSTFYDDEVTETFLPHTDQKSTIIAIGIGIPAYLAKSGKIYTNALKKEDYS
jgi:SagB-type dehydrogenase family enzyme